jgi:ferredoxin
MRHIVADLDRCVGAGQCVLTEPALFDQHDETGQVVILDDTLKDDEAVARANEAIHLCPSGALGLSPADPG